MAIKTVKYTFNGTTYDLTYNANTGKYEATVPAPSKSSYSQDGHKYGGSVIATDDAGNSTTINQSDATLGANLLLRVLEKVAPTLAFTYPTAGAYITNATPAIRFKVTDDDSGVNPDTIVIKVDGAKVTTAFTKQQSPVVTNASTRREQHWQMALTPYLLKHPTMMETLQQLRRSHLRLIQFHRHLHLQIQQMGLSQINPLWLYLVKQTMLHLNL